MNLRRSEVRVPAWALLLWLCSGTALAKESDQFSDRRWQIAYYAGGYRTLKDAPGPEEIDRVLDAEMNRLLGELLEELNDQRPEDDLERVRCIQQVFQHPLLAELITPYEEWLGNEAPVPLYRVRDKGIFGRAVNYDDMRISWYIESCPVIQAGGVLMGVDKPGHFLAQGFQYYLHYLSLPGRMREAEKLNALRDYGHESEVGNLGVATTGVYSYADLAANWQGFVFHRALFDDVEVQGEKHAAYFRVDGTGRYHLLREFHWAEWVEPDWDEVLNPAHAMARPLFEKVSRNFWYRAGREGARRPSVCDEYRSDPDAFRTGPRLLRPRSDYARVRPEGSAPGYAIDVGQICKAPPPRRSSPATQGTQRRPTKT